MLPEDILFSIAGKQTIRTGCFKGVRGHHLITLFYVASVKANQMRSCVFHDLTYLGAMGTAEHMLFFSSEKYPEEDSYSKYLTEVNCQIFFLLS